MKKFLVSVLFIGLFFASLPSFAITEATGVKQDAVLSLEDCVNIALQNSPNVKKYRGYLKAAKSRVGQARSDYFPTLTGSTGFNYSGDYPSRGTSTSEGIYTASASLNQLIYNFGKTGASINMRKFYVIASQADLDNIILQTIFNVRTYYYAVLAAKANVDVQKAYVQINERQYQRTKAFFEEGLRSKIDLVNSEVYLSESKIDLITAQNTYENSLIQLNNAMYIMGAPAYNIQSTETFNFKDKLVPVSLKGIAEKDLYKLPEMEKSAVYTTSVEKNEILQDYKFKPFPYDLNQAIEMAKNNRPDLKSLQATYDALNQALRYAKKEFMPAITASAGYNFRDKTSNYYNNAFTAGAYLDFPVINGLNTKYKIDEAKANLAVALDSLNMTEQDIYFSVQKAFIDMKKLEKQIPLQAVKVKQTLENFELADGRYEVGLSNFIELQDAKVNYNNAQQQYVKIVFDYNVARAKLELAMAMIPEEIKTVEEIK